MSGVLKRLRIARGQVTVELLPTKGLSIGQAWVGTKPLFWEPPLAEPPDPEGLDPTVPPLAPGESLELRLLVQFLEPSAAEELDRRIRSYNDRRKE